MPAIDLVDETFIAAAPERVRAAIERPERWREWFPELDLVVFMDRGLEGIRWSVTGECVGSAEVWIEAHADGAIVHHYQRLDPTSSGSASTVRELDDSPRAARERARLRQRAALEWKRHVWALKDELEGTREPGDPAHS